MQSIGHATVTLAGTPATTPMVSGMTYFPSGAPHTMTTNSGSATVTGTWGLDNRLRVTSYQNLSTANSGNTNYGYSLSYTANGNVKTDAEVVFQTGVGAKSWSWTFNYDTLNRLLNAQSTGAIQYGCQETYDPWGNRTAQAPFGGSGYSCTSISAPVNPNNQLSNAAYRYDAAGNLLYDGTNTLTYDGEGRIATSFSPVFGVTTSYAYGADGQRINKTFSSFQTEYIHDPEGSLLATYVNGSYFGNFQDMWIGGKHFGEVSVASGGASQTQNFSLTNWLGSQAAYTNPSTGIPTAAYLSQPFGDAQTALFGSNNDDIHFTGKERDGESGNDYFGARYYASSMGRWMSPDESLDGAIMELPQTWNKYSYEYNRPTYGTDPDGRCPPCIGALIGGVVEGGFDAGKQFIHNGYSFNNFSGKEFFANVAGGAVSGAIVGATGGASIVANALIGDVAAGATGNIIGGIVTRGLDPNSSSDEVMSVGNVSEDALSGFVGGAAGHVASEFVHVPDEPTHNGRGSVGAIRRDNAKFSRYYRAAVNQAVRSSVAGSAATHTSNGFQDWLNGWFLSGPHCHTEQTSIIINGSNGNPIDRVTGEPHQVCD